MYNWFKLPVRTLQWNTYFLRYLECFSRYSENVKERERKKIENFQKHIYAILRDVCVQVLSVMTMITTTLVCLARFHSSTWYCGEWTSPRLKLMIYDVTTNSHSISFFTDGSWTDTTETSSDTKGFRSSEKGRSKVQVYTNCIYFAADLGNYQILSILSSSSRRSTTAEMASGTACKISLIISFHWLQSISLSPAKACFTMLKWLFRLSWK